MRDGENLFWTAVLFVMAILVIAILFAVVGVLVFFLGLVLHAVEWAWS